MTTPGPLRCLWIGRDIPVPANTGDRIYSARLAESLCESGVDLVYFGLGNAPLTERVASGAFRWLPIAGRMKSYRWAVFSKYPLVSAALGTVAMTKALDVCLAENWDAIVLDNYATVWALEAILGRRGLRSKVVLVHVSHNFESVLARSLVAAYRGSLIKRLILLVNYWKIRHWERRLIRECDILTTITDDDLDKMRRMGRRDTIRLTLTPGYSGPKPDARDLQNSKRRVVLVGSFRWVVKQENLRTLVNLADPVFAANDISLDIIGDVPKELIAEFAGHITATTFHGFVDDYSGIFNAGRIAIVPEVLGGGFKLKILDYIFGGLPVAALNQASAGLPEVIKRGFITSDSLDDLIHQIVAKIDDIEILNIIQIEAARAAADLFDWADRGRKLLKAIETARNNQ